MRPLLERTARWPRRPRIGLGISSEAIRAAGVRGHAIAWAIEAPLDAGVALADQISELLSRIPDAHISWPRPRVTAAVGPAQVQAKRLAGLPPMTDAQVASGLVREGVTRFFMTGTEPLVTSDALIDEESGGIWAAAFEQRVVDAIETACREAKLSLDGILPAVAVLPAATADVLIPWRDGETCVEVTAEAGAMRAVHRLAYMASMTTAAGGEARAEAHPVPALAVLGEDAMRFADAYGAAVSRGDGPALRAPLRRDSAAATVVSPRRAALAMGLCAASIIAAAIASGIAAERAGRDARDELGTLSAARAELHDAERNLGLVSGALSEVAEVEARRRSALAFLGQLTTVLPERSAIVALRLDSAGGTVVALTPRAASLVNRLDTIASVAGPEIVGPVTREVVSGLELERVTVRFSLSPVRAAAEAQALASSRIEPGVSVSAASAAVAPDTSLAAPAMVRRP